MECKLTAIDVHASPGSSIRTLVLLAPSSSFPFRVRGAATAVARAPQLCSAFPAARRELAPALGHARATMAHV